MSSWFSRFRSEIAGAWHRATTESHDYEAPTELEQHPRKAEESPHKADGIVPFGVRVAAAWTWRLIVIAVGVWVLIQVVSALELVIIPTAIAILLAAMMQPLVARLRRTGFPSSLAAGGVLLFGLAAVVGVLIVVIRAFVDGFPDISRNVQESIAEFQDWLKTGPLHLTDTQIQDALDALQEEIQERSDQLTQSAIDTAGAAATTAGHVLTGFFLVLFATFFFLKDGRIIWHFVLRFLPVTARSSVDEAGHYAWKTLVSYVRATILVAFVDAVGIGIAFWLLVNAKLAIPIAALVFLTAFIPIVGALLSGTVAVAIALVDKGFIVALLMLAAVLIVQQVEGHVLQPLLMGHAVSIHPLAIVLAIAAGVILAGLIGALIAVPFVAVINTTIKHLHRRHRADEEVVSATTT